jgi:hypothetical protein
VPPASHPKELVQEAINYPLGNISLKDFMNARTVAIAINDKTRPVPHGDLLPPLLNKFPAPATMSLPPSILKRLIALKAAAIEVAIAAPTFSPSILSSL